MRKLLAFILIFSIFTTLSACSSSKNEKKNDSNTGKIEEEAKEEITNEVTKEAETIYGSWECIDYAGAIYTFNEDGTGSYTFAGASMDFEYTDDGNAVTILYPGNTVPSTYKYTVEDDKLNIEDSVESIVVYEKIK